MAAGLVAHADAVDAPSVWLTVSEGGPQAPDLVEVAVDRVTVFNDARIMQVRLSRSGVRQGYDGKPYRSAEAMVQVDCLHRTAGYSKLRLYDQPRWTGLARDATFASDNLPKMAFNDMKPNPGDRIIDAACRIDEVKSTNRRRH